MFTEETGENGKYNHCIQQLMFIARSATNEFIVLVTLRVLRDVASFCYFQLTVLLKKTLIMRLDFSRYLIRLGKSYLGLLMFGISVLCSRFIWLSSCFTVIG